MDTIQDEEEEEATLIPIHSIRAFGFSHSLSGGLSVCLSVQSRFLDYDGSVVNCDDEEDKSRFLAEGIWPKEIDYGSVVTKRPVQ